LKPISFDRFLKSVNKAGELLRSESASFHSSTNGEGDNFPSDFLFVKADYHIHKVRLSDILFIEGMKDYLRIHLPDERIMTLMSFIRMEKALPPERFMRVHKSFIVSLEKIERIERNIILVTTHKIPIGNKYKKQFFDFIGKDMMSGQRRHFCTGLSGQTM